MARLYLLGVGAGLLAVFEDTDLNPPPADVFGFLEIIWCACGDAADFACREFSAF